MNHQHNAAPADAARCSSDDTETRIHGATAPENLPEPAKTGVLIINLGTPTAPTAQALRPYLAQFLSDPRVVELPRLLWWLILHGFILRTRPARSARAYRRIWTEQGSPLLTNSQALLCALERELNRICPEKVHCALAMRYNEPAIGAAIESLMNRGVRRLLIVPLYPQYSSSTTASTFDAVAADFKRRRRLPELHFVADYHDHAPYITALAASVRAHWRQHGRADKLLISFHGTPQSYRDKGDPYFEQCQHSARLLAAELGITEAHYQVTFQSRFGRTPWLQPYTDAVLKDLPAQGVETVQVICPGFAADCLETLEEIAVENRALFIDAGGQRFDYIPALNSQPEHASALAQLIADKLAGLQCSDRHPAGETTRAR